MHNANIKQDFFEYSKHAYNILHTRRVLLQSKFSSSSSVHNYLMLSRVDLKQIQLLTAAVTT